MVFSHILIRGHESGPTRIKAMTPLQNLRARHSGENRGFSLIELLIVVAIILIIAAIAIPGLLRSKMAANEASAAESLRAINTGCVTFSSVYGIGYPTTLAQLTSSTPGQASSGSADLIDEVLGAGLKSGYAFTLTGGAATAGVVPTYTV